MREADGCESPSSRAAREKLPVRRHAHEKPQCQTDDRSMKLPIHYRIKYMLVPRGR